MPGENIGSNPEKPEKEENAPKGEHGKIWTEWNFAEYPKYERSKTWYFWFILIIVGLLVFAIFDSNPLLGIMVVMVALIIFFQGRKEPNQIKFQITEDGIVLDTKLYSYEQLNKFWIIYKPPEVKDLYFGFKNALRPELAIPLGNINPIVIRQRLLNYLEEDITKENESFSSGLRRMLKF